MFQVLNLTGSLIEVVNPANMLHYFNFIDNLTVLELGENQVSFLNKVLFAWMLRTMFAGSLLEQDPVQPQP